MLSWGSVAGDGDAEGIAHRRRADRLGQRIVGFLSFALTSGFAIWFANTGSSTALALEIIAAAWLAACGVGSIIYPTFTLLMIAERRIQLVEQQVQEIRDAQRTLEDATSKSAWPPR